MRDRICYKLNLDIIYIYICFIEYPLKYFIECIREYLMYKIPHV